ncbi:hypothetical protein [Raineyella fluvialis]|uniref:Uncharacterized protein n=1 Tax=Raineyella fluvialis TaxID=2662261 RepID=A0A5Q2FJF8_9ACTN|nr:hypothetical protein [Raineyella fluvialis]QGF24795.1 hypothetical protein Rai3103_15465 [Raineyella fluvialis]
MTAPPQPSSPRPGAAGLPPAAPFGADPIEHPPAQGGPPTPPMTPLAEHTTAVLPSVPAAPGEDELPATPPPSPRGTQVPGRGPVAAPIPTTNAPRRARPPRRGRRLPKVVVGTVLALVLLAGALLTWRSAVGREYDTRLTTDRAAARQVAEAYLGALRDANAAAALDTAATRPRNASLLTDDTLRGSQASGGVTGIRVGEATVAHDATTRVVGDTGTVQAHYLIGGKPVDVQLPVTRVGSRWKMSAVTARVDLGGPPTRSVDGKVPEASTVDLFPGTYRIATTSTYVTLAQPDLVVTAPDPVGDTAKHWSGGSPSLSADAKDRILRAAQASLSACLGQKSLNPAGCPIAITTGPAISVNEATIAYTLLDDPWQGVEVAYEDSTGGATGRVPLHYRLDAAATNGSVEGVVRQDYRYDATFVADLTGTDPAISWK